MEIRRSHGHVDADCACIFERVVAFSAHFSQCMFSWQGHYCQYVLNLSIQSWFGNFLRILIALRVFHFNLMCAGMLAVVQDYIAKINAYALGLLYQFVPAQFPQLADPNADPIVTYVAQVRADIARRNAALSTLTLGSQVGYLFIYGGTSDAAGGVTSDIWIFDTVSLLWQVPVCLFF